MPQHALPVVLDVGTNTEQYLKDKEYLGIPEKRCDDETYYTLLDEFMHAASTIWPGAVIQFEDFSNNHCFDILERYQEKYRCFNDDIQGTGAVISAGFLNAVKLSGIAPLQHRIVVFGAGSAAVGVAKNIAQLTARLHGVSFEDVLKTFYLVDTKGLVTDSRGDKLPKHKVLLARHDIPKEHNDKLKELLDVVKYVKPTALIGLGGVGPVFTEEIVKIVLQNNPHPIIFPLSNPTSKSEVNP
uniref:NADP-dependent malic enzyme n=1 Tax=Lygus hesperus TaxID=30085 RepID=A0A0A9XGX1_LYGHE